MNKQAKCQPDAFIGHMFIVKFSRRMTAYKLGKVIMSHSCHLYLALNISVTFPPPLAYIK